MADQTFIEVRQQIREMLAVADKDGKMVATVPLEKSLYVKTQDALYQVVGINASFVNGKYVEIFVAVDLTTTLQHFDGNAVKSHYFDLQTIQQTTEISEVDAKKQYVRSDWRRVQKYIKKEIKNIVKQEYEVELPGATA